MKVFSLAFLFSAAFTILSCVGGAVLLMLGYDVGLYVGPLVAGGMFACVATMWLVTICLEHELSETK